MAKTARVLLATCQNLIITAANSRVHAANTVCPVGTCGKERAYVHTENYGGNARVCLVWYLVRSVLIFIFCSSYFCGLHPPLTFWAPMSFSMGHWLSADYLGPCITHWKTVAMKMWKDWNWCHCPQKQLSDVSV